MIQKIRESQKTHLQTFFGDVIDASSLTKDQAQRLIMQGKALKSEFAQFFKDFKQKALWEGCVYPQEYRRKPIDRQVLILGKVFELSTEKTMEFIQHWLPKTHLPKGAEGWFAIPSISAVAAKHFPQVNGPVDQYRECIRFASKKMKETREFSDYGLGFINHHSFEASPRFLSTSNSWNIGGQTGDILIIPAQLGLRHRGKSIYNAVASFSKDEFPLGMFEVLSLLLTHPKRMSVYANLCMTCADNQFRDPEKKHGEYPNFYMNTTSSDIDRLDFDNRMDPMEEKEYVGVVSGFKF